MMKIDLSGQWRVKLDAEKQETMPQAYPETMMLPGTTSAAGLGMPNSAKETGCLTDAYRFEGAAWFMRTFTAGDWTGEQTMLTLVAPSGIRRASVRRTATSCRLCTLASIPLSSAWIIPIIPRAAGI